MKKIPWHNPAQQTPPKGYRLLIPEEVDGRFKGIADNALLFSTSRHYWAPVYPLASVDNHEVTYAVPSDTPLPDGYTLIDSDVWQMNGWTAHTPGDGMRYHVKGKAPMDPDTLVEVTLRNGVVVKGPRKNHWFGQIPNSLSAEIIGWRVVAEGPPTMGTEECAAQQAPKPLMALDAEEKAHKPMTATEAMELQMGLLPPELLSAWEGEVAKVMSPIYHKIFKALNSHMLDENQRLKNELADAQATLKSIRSLLP